MDVVDLERSAESKVKKRRVLVQVRTVMVVSCCGPGEIRAQQTALLKDVLNVDRRKSISNLSRRSVSEQ